jgi:hypothetical protein
VTHDRLVAIRRHLMHGERIEPAIHAREYEVIFDLAEGVLCAMGLLRRGLGWPDDFDADRTRSGE